MKICKLNEELSLLDILSLLNRDGVDGTLKGSAYIAVLQQVLGGGIRGASLFRLRLDAIHFGSRVSLMLLLLQQLELRISRCQPVCRVPHLGGSSSAGLCQPLQRVVVLLCSIAFGLRLDQLGTGIQNFFLSSPSLNGMLISFCCLHLRERPRCLGTRVGILKLHQQIAGAHMLSLADENLLHRRGCRRVSFEILD